MLFKSRFLTLLILLVIIALTPFGMVWNFIMCGDTLVDDFWEVVREDFSYVVYGYNEHRFK